MLSHEVASALRGRSLAIEVSPFSFNKAYNSFKSQGRTVSKDSMYRFLGYIQDAFLLFTVEMHNPSQSVRAANPKKIYAVDPGLVTSFSGKRVCRAESNRTVDR